MKLVIKYISVFLLALVATGFSHSSPEKNSETSTPEQVAETFARAIYSNDIDTLFDILHFSKVAIQMGSKSTEEVKNEIETIVYEDLEEAKTHGGLDKIECSPAEYNKADINQSVRATVGVTITFKDGTQNSGKVTLIENGKTWSVFSTHY